MSDVGLTVVYIICVTGFLFLSFLAVAMRKKIFFNTVFYVCMCLAAAEISLCYMIFHILPGGYHAYLAYELKFIGFAMTPAFLMMFIMQMYGYDKYLKSINISLLFIVPAITVILAATNNYHGLFRSEVRISVEQGYKIMIAENGIWYWVHVAYSYLLTLLTIFLIISRYSNRRASFNIRDIILIFGCIITWLFNILYVFRVINESVDITVVGMLISMVFFFWALFRYNSSDFLLFARYAVFMNIPNPLAILDGGKRILETNKEMMALLHDVKFDIGIDTWDHVIELLKQTGVKISEKNDTILITVQKQRSEFFYELVETSFTDRRSHEKGYYVVLSDVTNLNKILLRYKSLARSDKLTGLGNRLYLEEIIEEWDTEENHPLGIIFGDINYLKEANDNFGHNVGDMYICEVSNILVETLPENAKAFRVGGDEFVCLLYNTSEGELNRIRDEIINKCKNQSFDIPVTVKASQEYLCPIPIGRYISDDTVRITLSFAVGTALRESILEPLDLILNKADGASYQDKKRIKDSMNIRKEASK